MSARSRKVIQGKSVPVPLTNWKDGILGMMIVLGIIMMIFSEYKIVAGLLVGLPLVAIARRALADQVNRKEVVALSTSLFDASPSAVVEADVIAPPRMAPVGCGRVELPEKDNWEVSGLSGERLPLHVDLEIAYVDGQGQASRRRITTRCVENYGDSGDAIHAFCHERKSMRTFLISRIREMIDLETGEVVDDPVMFFRHRYADSPAGRVAAALAGLDDELVAVMYVARADGRLVKKERDLVVSFVASWSEVELDLDVLDREIRYFNPSHRDFALALKNLKAKPENMRRQVVELGRQIIAVEKKVDLMEEAAVEKLSLALLSA